MICLTKFQTKSQYSKLSECKTHFCLSMTEQPVFYLAFTYALKCFVYFYGLPVLIFLCSHYNLPIQDVSNTLLSYIHKPKHYIVCKM